MNYIPHYKENQQQLIQRRSQAAANQEAELKSAASLSLHDGNSASPGLTQVQTVINSSPRVAQIMKYQEMADKRPQHNAINQLKSIVEGRSGNKASQYSIPVVQLAAEYQVSNVLGHPASPAAAAKQEIVTDLTEQTGGKLITFEESGGTPWVQAKQEVKQAALAKGYDEDAATRLVERKPFKRSDIKAKSTIQKEDGSITSFYNVVNNDHPFHQLFFYNTYKAGKWAMEDNFRNPYLASFFANELVEEQKALVTEKGNHAPGDLRTLVRANIVSKSGVKWAKDNAIPNGDLSEEHLTSFKLTENGQHSVNTARDQKVKITGGTVSGIKTDGSTAYKYFRVELRCEPIVVPIAV